MKRKRLIIAFLLIAGIVMVLSASAFADTAQEQNIDYINEMQSKMSVQTKSAFGTIQRIGSALAVLALTLASIRLFFVSREVKAGPREITVLIKTIKYSILALAALWLIPLVVKAGTDLGQQYEWKPEYIVGTTPTPSSGAHWF